MDLKTDVKKHTPAKDHSVSLQTEKRKGRDHTPGLIPKSVSMGSERVMTGMSVTKA